MDHDYGLQSSAAKKLKVSPSGTNVSQQSDDKQDNDMFQALCCSICCEVMHDSISLQPCGHCFCGGCFSDWMQRSHRCPECRLKVKRVSKNHRMNNLVDIYLQSHAEKVRPAEDLRNLDAKNKFTSDIFVMPSRDKSLNITLSDSSTSDDSDSDSDSTSGDDTDSDSVVASAAVQKGGTNAAGSSNQQSALFPNQIAAHHYSPMNIPVCVQCSNFGKAPYNVTGTLIRPPTLSNVPKFVCARQQSHVQCFCCRSFMPDRRKDPTISKWPQECKICSKTFCNLYFGCSRYGCGGCLCKFEDFKFDLDIFRNIVNENYFETEVLKDHLQRNGKSWPHFQKECMQKMDAGELNCQDKVAFDLKSDSIICLTCALKNLRDLAYEYRKHLQVEDKVGKRLNCWYGRNCRTQKTKLAHAEKLNHICEQTKF